MYIFGGMFSILQECNELLKFNFIEEKFEFVSTNVIYPSPYKSYALSSQKKPNPKDK